MGDRQMGGDTGRLREEIIRRLKGAGFCAVGFTAARRVGDDAIRDYESWLAEGMAAEMAYLHNHLEIRKDPRLLLEGARSIICMAYDYTPNRGRDAELPVISAYALLPDYHEFLRKLIRGSGVGELLGAEGRDWRICVDSAPVMERYWAEQAGIGRLGANGMVIVPGVGSQVFLAEIITKLDLTVGDSTPRGKARGTMTVGDEHPRGKARGTVCCLDCGLCLRACPTGALQADGKIDCERCISYLTIEHRGEWKEGKQREAMETAAGKRSLFGCDRCIAACPLNKRERGELDERERGCLNNRERGDFDERELGNLYKEEKGSAERAAIRFENGKVISGLERVRTLTAEDILEGNAEQLKARIQGSCLKRAKLDGLARNASNISKDGDGGI